MLIETEESKLSLAQKFDILYLILKGSKISVLLDDLDKPQILEARRFVWEKALEFGIWSKGNGFSRDEIIERLKFLNSYQKEKGCREPIQKCRSLDCYSENSTCAVEKIKLEVDAIGRVIDEYIKS
jgi:hypothetical protein